MSKRKMFLRMITASLLRRRSRMLIALLSIGIGATILSGLVTIYVDVPRQMGAQFRSYGANMLLMPSGNEVLTQQAADEAFSVIADGQLVGASPYRYITVQLVKRQLSFVAAGTDFEQVRSTSPYFMVEGSWPSGNREILVGKQAAQSLGLRLGNVIQLTYKPETVVSGDGSDRVAGATLTGSAEGFGGGLVNVELTLGDDLSIASLTVDASSQTEGYGLGAQEERFTRQFIGKAFPVAYGDGVDTLSGATLTSQAVLDAINGARASEAGVSAGNSLNMTVVGLLDTGGEEENYIFMSLSDMAALTGEVDQLDIVEMSVSASSDELQGYVDAIAAMDSGVSARLVKRVTKSETAVLAKLQALVFLVTAVVLLLTMICVSTTMMAVVTERRKEIGLRKALGASDGSIRAEFLGEGMFLGGLGGLLGAVLGFGFAQLISVQVFESSITLQPLLLPVTMLISMAISALSCLLPIRSAVAIDPALVLKGE